MTITAIAQSPNSQQSPDDQLLEEVFKRHRERMELFEKQIEEMEKSMGMGSGFHQMMEELQKEFMQDDFFQQGKQGGGGQDKLFDRFEDLQSDYERQYEWKETENERIFEFSLPSHDESQPIDIKVANGMISIKGEVKKIKKIQRDGRTQDVESRENFAKSIGLPKDVDQANPVIEKTAQGFRIKFTKKNQKKKSPVLPNDQETVL